MDRDFGVTTTRENWRVGPRDGKYLRIITADLARDTLRRDQMTGKFTRNRADYTVIVDHRPGRNESSVRHGGRISYVSNAQLDAAEVLMYIKGLLFKLSPIGIKRPGVDVGWRAKHYIDAHEFLVNGRGPYSFSNISSMGIAPPNAVFDVRSPLVYARRIEGWGKMRGKGGWSLQRPSGVLKIAVIMLRKKFGAGWTFNYSLERYNDLQNFKIWRMEGKRAKKRVFYTQLYPAITFMRKSGSARLIRGQRQPIQ